LITFTKVNLPYVWLGNMSPHPVMYGGLRWKTCEALFQALRFAEDAPVRELIRASPSPMAAKMIAKKHREQMIVVPRQKEDIKNMILVLQVKLEQHPDLAELLRATGTEEIIEDMSARPSSNALFWGKAYQGSTWVGQGYLGRIWEKLRSKLPPG
jgi:N-glycosidase YbiA